MSSLAALAARDRRPPRCGCPLIDARRGEVFAALYEGAAEGWAPFVGDAARSSRERIREARRSTPLAAGDGSVRFRERARGGGGRGRAATIRRSTWSRAARLPARGRTAPAVPPEAVLPVYLRDPDAKPHDRQ